MDILRPGPDGPNAQASVKAGALHVQVLFDDGHIARELTDREEAFVQGVLRKFGHDLADAV
jgi:hypothetical protein